MLENSDEIFDEDEVNETVKCLMCGWEGFVAELEEDCCPMCGSEHLL